MKPDIAVVAERLDVSVRTVETARVHIRTRVVETEQFVDLPLRRDEVQIERVSIHRVVGEASAVRQEGDVTIVPVYEEVLLVTRQLVLKEELRITRVSSVQAGTPQRFKLRRDEVEIERRSVDPAD